ncbi:MAG TPA: hypothetical protein DIT64_04380 [Verrucomicrobiales bacterium]|nr:hypothetical protein [Verrucomicrobiales bacterium]HRJ07021.1 hypothetical protein [Prosthecobacter sp.]HRK16562.1 hypothetical protein [Prosthecobacter sp.]
MKNASPLPNAGTHFSGFALVSFGELNVPGGPMEFGFQLDFVPDEIQARQLIFGLLCHSENSPDGEHGFAVRVDLTTGEIWDALNDNGIVGWVENPDKLERFSTEEPLLMSWRVEHLGGALIPKLHIAGEDHLYPSLRYEPGMVMTTVAGTDGGLQSALNGFMHPAVWQELM